MSDCYGIPDNMFGPAITEKDFGMVGRLVMVTAVLELRLLDLLNALGVPDVLKDLTQLTRDEQENTSPQHTHAGKSGTELIKGCRAALANYNSSFADPARAVLERASTALEKRHEVVHSIWTSPMLGGSGMPSQAEQPEGVPYGWRPVSKGRRTDQWQPVKSARVKFSQLPDLINQSVALVAEVERVARAAPPECKADST